MLITSFSETCRGRGGYTGHLCYSGEKCITDHLLCKGIFTDCGDNSDEPSFCDGKHRINLA